METKNNHEIKEYDFDTIEILKAGFAWINGVKLQFVIAFFIYILIAIIVQTLLGLIFPTESGGDINLLNGQIIGILSYPVLMPLLAGIMMMALKHTRDEKVDFKSIFDYYHLMGILALSGVVIYVMTLIGFILFILPGIYVSVAYVFVPMLIVDKQMGLWEAMEHSRKTVTYKWFKVAGLMGLLGIIMFLGTLAMGIGLIWAIPLMFVTLYGLLYPVMFEEE